MKDYSERMTAIETRSGEIAQRLADIAKEVDLDDADVTALQAEVDALIEEREQLNAQKTELNQQKEQRQQVLDNIASGAGITLEEKGEQTLMFTRDTQEYRALWLKNLQGVQMTEEEQRDYTSSSASSGNAIPEATQDLLFEKMSKLAPMLSEITLLRVAGNVTFSTQGQRDDAYQHGEGDAITAATDTLVKVSLAGYEYNKLLYVSKTVQTMAINAFEGWLIDMIAEDIAAGIESAIINGDGSGAPKGILHAATWATTTNLVEVTGTYKIVYADVVKLISQLPARYDANAKFLADKSMVYQGLASIVDTNNRPLLVNDLAGPYPFRVLGYPVIVSDKCPAKTLFLGDFKKVVGNLAQDITVERDASAGFASNSIAYRGGAIFDCDIALDDAFVKLTTATY